MSISKVGQTEQGIDFERKLEFTYKYADTEFLWQMCLLTHFTNLSLPASIRG